MSFLRRALRNVTVTYTREDLVAVSLLAAVVAGWACLAGDTFSLRALIACEAIFLALYLVGSLVAGFSALASGVLFDLPLRLLVGYGVINTALLVLAWVSPLGIVANFCLVVALAVVLLFATKARTHGGKSPTALWAVGIVALATTLWCQDSIRPRVEEENVVIFKPWIDGFYHAVHIRIFAESHGASTIEDYRLAGVPARLYHYGAYLLPALVKQAAGIPSYVAFAGILAPLGIFFSGLAAYAFCGSIWGAWPGVAAAVALLLLPDGAQQGMQNPFMSYHWLTQIAPGSAYGLALMAVGWLFVIQGCIRGSRAQLAFGWLVAGVVALYKLHFVIASALLLLLVPALFFRARLSTGKRASLAAAACAVYAAAMTLGQRVPGVPLIRFDGSSAGEVLRLIQTFAKPGSLRELVVQHLGPQFSLASNLLYGIPYVLLATFGVSLPLFVILLVRLRRRTPLLYLLFPVLIIVNFSTMFFGLALDFERSTPDELSHRPVMLVYFFVVSWVGAALAFALANSPRLGSVARPAILGVAGVLLVVPAYFGPGVQLMWAMPRISPVRVPRALIRVADYIRTHGGPEDIFQDSQFDRVYAIAALAERRTFVSHTMTTMPFRADMVATRSAAIDRLMAMEQPKLVLGTARAFGLRWFVLQRGNRVNWPPALADRPVFETGAFKIYEF